MTIPPVFYSAGLDSLWSPGAGCWFAGVWTGPDRDLICVKKCDTREDAELWLSPEATTPEEAIRLAAKKHLQLVGELRACGRCGFVGQWEGDARRWCPRCDAELAGDSR